MVTAACNWLTFTASVAAAPAATFVRRRSWPDAPTDTSPAGVVPDSVPVADRYAAALRLDTVVEFAPSATELFAVAFALPPIATAFVPVANESVSVEFDVEVHRRAAPPGWWMLFTVLVMLIGLLAMIRPG